MYGSVSIRVTKPGGRLDRDHRSPFADSCNRPLLHGCNDSEVAQKELSGLVLHVLSSFGGLGAVLGHRRNTVNKTENNSFSNRVFILENLRYKHSTR